MLIYCTGFVRESAVLDTVTTICICEEIAARLFLPDQDREMIYYAALLHDLGMLGDIAGHTTGAPQAETGRDQACAHPCGHYAGEAGA